jgi:site-specific DNA recombinase
MKIKASGAHFLRNRFYSGEVVFKGEVFPDEQPAIVIFGAVQAKLHDQCHRQAVDRGRPKPC